MTTVPYIKHSATSKAAGESQRPQLNEKEQAVLDAIAKGNLTGMTDDELEARFVIRGWASSTARARRVALEDKGLIVPSDICRKTRCNRWARVYVVAEPEQARFDFAGSDT